MDDSDVKPIDISLLKTQSHGEVMLRALASAAVFGAIGGALGRWLGRRGNDVKSKLAEPLMQWGMGSFWGVLAAYSSLKASEHTAIEAREARQQAEQQSRAGKAEMAAADEKIPTTAVRTKDAVIRGEVAPALENQRT